MKTLVRLSRLIAPEARWLVLGAFAALLVALSNVALLALAGWFLAAMAAAGLAGGSLNYFTPATGIRAFAIVRTAGRYFERLLTHDASLRALARLRVWLYTRLEPLAPAGLESFGAGDLAARLGADVDRLGQFYTQLLVPLAVALIGGCGVLIFTLWFSVRAFAVEAALLLLIGVLLPLAALRTSRGPAARAVAAESTLRDTWIEGMRTLMELITFGVADAYRKRIAADNIALEREQNRLQRLRAAHAALAGAATGLAGVAMVAVLIPLITENRLDHLALPMLALFVAGSAEIVQGLPAAWQGLGEILAAARRLFELADRTPPVTEPCRPRPVPARGALRFEAVSARYAPDGPLVLDAVSFEIPEGARLAVVGPSGAGKSTLLALVLRFLTPESGRILYGGTDLANLAGEALRRRCAVVTQQVHLFSGTLADNLRIARPDASQQELEAACRLAQLEEEIAALPQGYDTYLGEGGLRLSTGQARRLAVARALLRDAPLLLLDEPTEGLDAVNEARLMQALLEVMRNRTTLLITHRPMGLAAMDEIVLLDRGRVTARGNYGNLRRENAHLCALLALADFDRLKQS